MKLSKIFIFIGMMATSQAIFSQARFTEDKSRLSADLKAVMETSKNEQAIKIGQTFDGVWNSGALSDKQKQQIYSILISMQKKRYRVNPNYMGYFSLFNNAVGSKKISGAKLDSLIYVTSQVLENHPVNLFQKYLDFSNNFLAQDRLYSSNFNWLTVQAPSFSFWYIDPKTVANAEAAAPEPEPSNVEKLNDENFDWSTSFSDEATKKPAGSKDVNMEEVLNAEATAPSVILPTISGPIIRLRNAVFTITSKHDSASFKNIRGTAMAFNNLFVGEKATFDWSYAGLNGNEVFAELDKFSLNLSKEEVFAENVTFTYKGKTEKPVVGSFAFKALNKINKTNTPYPAFASYSNKINLGNIGEGITITGGFSLSGKIINTTSADMGNSSLTYSKSGVLKFKAVSKGFEITDSVVSSRQAAVIIPFAGDSIYHFGTKLSFFKTKKQLKLVQSTGNFKNASYYDTYHKVEINAEAATYDIAKEKMEFYVINARNQVPVTISSNDYFEENQYDQLKGMFPFNPLQLAMGFAKSGKGNSFYADDLASANKLNPATVRTGMSFLGQDGFAEYNPQTGFVKLTKKAWHYYSSKMNKKDYDEIQLKCLSPQKANVILDMTTKKMVANGIKKAYLCRPLNVFMETDSTNEVIVEKNRSLTFNGTINAGRFLFTSKNYKFDYDSFMVRMGKVEAINISVSKGGSSENYGKDNVKHKKLGIELEQSRGDLYINKPNNKSGKRTIPNYPIFNASTGGMVYFDKKDILKGAYDKKVVFKIPPFSIDSLNSEKEQSIAFDGTFISNGIFPNFKERLTLQSDLSLGFEHTTPKVGYPIYGGKGTYFDKISLNTLGIRGSGKLETMNSTIVSEDLIFYPDSLVAFGSSAEVKKMATAEVHHPDILIEEHELKWYPKKDTLIFKQYSKPFSLYAKSADFEGSIGLTPKSSFGNGKMITKGSEIISREHLLRDESFVSRYANFKINSADSAKPNMVASNAKIDFSLKSNKALISSEIEGFASDTFPYIQYSCSISKCEWDLEKQTLVLGSKKDMKTVKGTFYNVSKEADSLSFLGGYAFYDIKKQYLKVEGVPYINVADSEILPDSGTLTISEGGRIATLKKAIVRMDTVNRYHVLTEAQIDIVSKKTFTGDAYLNYVSSEKEKHKIKVIEFAFNNVVAETKSKRKQKNFIARNRRITIAKTEISEDENMHISEGILFKGEMDLHSYIKNPVLNGFVKLDLKRNNSMGSWIAYQHVGDSSQVVINLADAKSDNGTDISTGLHLSIDGSKLYSSFISSKESAADKDVFKVTGNLKFDPTTKEFVVSDPKKMENAFSEGNLYAFNDNNSSLRIEGKANFIPSLPDFEITTSVLGKGNLDSSKYNFNTLISIPMTKVNPAALASMALNISEYASQGNSPYANDYTDALRLKLVNAVGQKAFTGYEKQVGQGNQKVLGTITKLSAALVLSQVNLEWSSQHYGYYSKGLIGVSNILKKEINAMVEGFVEIKHNTTGDAIKILLTPNADTWYFLSYENGRLALCSNDEEFTKSILAKSKGEAPGKFSCVPADPSEKMQFNRDFNLNYLGKEVFDEYKPAEGTSPIESLPSEQTSPAPEEVTPAESVPVAEPKKEEKKKKKKGEVIEQNTEKLPTEEAPTEEAPAETAPIKESPTENKVEETNSPNPTEASPSEEAPSETAPDENSEGKKKKKKSKKEQALEQQGF
jgi:hypothetical protein